MKTKTKWKNVKNNNVFYVVCYTIYVIFLGYVSGQGDKNKQNKN